MIGWGILSIAFFLFTFYGLTKKRKVLFSESKDWPMVSVLIAVRNEEQNLPQLFQSLEKIDYPTDRLEILFGNDASEDSTVGLLEKYHSQFSVKLISVEEKDKSCGPKGGVLQVLSEYAKGDFLYFTDADVRVNPTVIKELVAINKDLVGAVTVPETGFWGSYEKIDWLYNFFLVGVMAPYKQTVAIMGNNLMVKTAVFKQVSGFKNCKIPLVEDYSLLKKMQRLQKTVEFYYSSESTNQVKASSSFKEIEHQRIRWALALRAIPIFYSLLYAFLILLDYSVLLNSLVLSVAYDWRLISGLGFWLVQYLCFYGFTKRLSFGVGLPEFLKYKLINLVLLPVFLVLLIIKRSVTWKGRKYGY